MSVDDTRYERHLTPRGWTAGSRPDDAVETVEVHIFQRTVFSEEQVTHQTDWTSPTVDPQELKRLKAMFGSLPD